MEADQEAEHEELLGFLYMCPAGVMRLDDAGAVQLMNPTAARLLQERIGGTAQPNLFDALDACAPELRALVRRHGDEPGTICENHRMPLRPDGVRPLVVDCTLMRTAPGMLMAVLQDVTRQVLQDRLLRQHEVMLDALIAGVNDFALFALDRDGRISTWNHSCVRQIGLSESEVIGRRLDAVFRDGTATAEASPPEVAASREGWSLREGWCRGPGGRVFRCQVLVAAVAQEGGEISGHSVVLRDVTERRMSVEEVGRLLTTDHLTGAVNRRRFFELASMEVARSRQTGRPLSLLLFDVDHFKRINDRHGHAVGDEVLRRLTARCAAECADGEVLARIGGEEFAVLLPGLPLELAAERAETMRRAAAGVLGVLERAGVDASLPLGVTISLGCAALQDRWDVTELMRGADTALYAAKRGGRNQVRCAGEAPPVEARREAALS